MKNEWVARALLCVLLGLLTTGAMVLLASPVDPGWATVTRSCDSPWLRRWVPSWLLGVCWVDSLLATFAILNFAWRQGLSAQASDQRLPGSALSIAGGFRDTVLNPASSFVDVLAVIVVGMCTSGTVVLSVQLGVRSLSYLALAHGVAYVVLLFGASVTTSALRCSAKRNT